MRGVLPIGDRTVAVMRPFGQQPHRRLDRKEEAAERRRSPRRPVSVTPDGTQGGNYQVEIRSDVPSPLARGGPSRPLFSRSLQVGIQTIALD